MPDESVFRFDDEGMRKLLKAMESDHVLRVGIFGGSHKEAGDKKKGGGRKVSTKSSGKTNAEVGWLAEFGRPKIGNAPKVPPRSWLRMPLINHINDIGKECQTAFEEQAKTGDAKKFMKYMGTRAEAWIQKAFADGGPGWPANTAYTIAQKGSDAPLIDTGQLRRAVASQVI